MSERRFLDPEVGDEVDRRTEGVAGERLTCDLDVGRWIPKVPPDLDVIGLPGRRISHALCTVLRPGRRRRQAENCRPNQYPRGTYAHDSSRPGWVTSIALTG